MSFFLALNLLSFDGHQISNYSRSLIILSLICILDYWNLQSNSFTLSILQPAFSSDQPATQRTDDMAERRTNPFSVPSTQQPTWSFDGVNDPQSSPLRTPNPIHHHHLTVVEDQPNGSPLSSLQIGRRRPLSTTDGDRWGWHNPSRGRANQQDRRSRRNANPRSHSNNNSAQREATLQNRRPPIPYPLGTREEVQSDDYVSPVEAMMSRAWGRYREAEEQRAASRGGAMNAAESPTNVTLNMLGTNPPQHPDPAQRFETAMNDRRRASEQEFRDRFQQILSFREDLHDPSFHSEDNPIDVQTSRPQPLDTEELTANIACRVCHEQKIDTLLEPCMHLAICHWCSEVLQERTRRYRAIISNPLYTSLHPQDIRLRCPICRRNVAQARRVFLGL